MGGDDGMGVTGTEGERFERELARVWAVLWAHRVKKRGVEEDPDGERAPGLVQWDERFEARPGEWACGLSARALAGMLDPPMTAWRVKHCIRELVIRRQVVIEHERLVTHEGIRSGPKTYWLFDPPLPAGS